MGTRTGYLSGTLDVDQRVSEQACSSPPTYPPSAVVGRLWTRGWGHPGTWLVLGLALGLLAAMLLGRGLSGRAAPASGQVVSEGSPSDCADTAMIYTLHKTRETARAAFHCMSGFVVRGMTEDDFIMDAERYAAPIAGDIRRVGEFAAPDGQRVVYFAVVGPSQTVGYTIYVDREGKVWRIA
jgi:hypothetical protein